MLNQLFHGIAALHHPLRAGAFVLFTCLIWAMDGIGVIVLAYSLKLQISFTQAILLLSSLGLSSAIPSTPGYVGIYQYVAVVILQPFGVPKESALAFVILLQALSLIITAFWGSISLWLAPKHVFITVSISNDLGE